MLSFYFFKRDVQRDK